MAGHILFVCPHGAAKSVMAAAYFRELNEQHGLTWTADAAGTEPDDMVASHVAALLQSEGIDVAGYTPRRVNDADLAVTNRVISLGCTDEELGVAAGQVEHWDDVPLPSQDLDGARAAIRAHIGKLITELPEV